MGREVVRRGEKRWEEVGRGGEKVVRRWEVGSELYV